MDKKYWQKLIFVNMLTGLRFIGSILLIPIYLNFGMLGMLISTIIFYSTDAIDGFAAKKLQVSTFFGALFDGMSDKLFDIIVLVILSFNNKLLLFLLLFEVLILIIGYNTAFKGNKIKSLKIGKIKTVIIDVAFILIIFLNTFCNNSIIILIIILISILFEILALIGYIKNDLEGNKSNALYQKEIKKTNDAGLKTTIKIYHEIKDNIIDAKEIKEKLFDHNFYRLNKNKPLKDLLVKKNKSL